MDPRLAIGSTQQPVGLLVAYDALIVRIPRQCPAEPERQVRQNTARRRDVALFDVRHRLAARSDSPQEILLVPAIGRGNVLLQVLLDRKSTRLNSSHEWIS